MCYPIRPPNLLDNLGEVLPVVRQPRLGLVVDFDGTIAEIAATPDEARISPGCSEVLESLDSRLSLVAVVSGRSADDLKEKVGLDGLLYVGNHGAEYLDGDELSVVPAAADYREQIKAAFDYLKATVDSPGLVWQDKGLGASVHYRLAPDADQARCTLESVLDSAPGVEKLEIFWGKLVLELRSPGGLNKGYAIRKLAQDWELDGVIFLGDDTTDLDAIRALEELAGKEGLRGLGAAVMYDDSPEGLLKAADYGLNGVREVQDFLIWLDNVTA